MFLLLISLTFNFFPRSSTGQCSKHSYWIAVLSFQCDLYKDLSKQYYLEAFPNKAILHPLSLLVAYVVVCTCNKHKLCERLDT